MGRDPWKVWHFPWNEGNSWQRSGDRRFPARPSYQSPASNTLTVALWAQNSRNHLSQSCPLDLRQVGINNQVLAVLTFKVYSDCLCKAGWGRWHNVPLKARPLPMHVIFSITAKAMSYKIYLGSLLNSLGWLQQCNSSSVFCLALFFVTCFCFLNLQTKFIFPQQHFLSLK